VPLDDTQARTAKLKTSPFRFPGGDSRTVVIGATGTGKTTFATWLLSHARFDKRPWVIIDYKREEIFGSIGSPPMQRLKVGQLPKRLGLYIMSPRPDDDDAVENWLWKIWARENVGIFIDEATLVPHQTAFKAILRQGRSKRIPLIACTQRPIDIEREVFTEASFISVFRIADDRDYKVIGSFTRGIELGGRTRELPRHWSWWYDVQRDKLLKLRPAPQVPQIVERVRANAPRSWFLG
jgi:DNA helicase HerA-like ATPase